MNWRRHWINLASLLAIAALIVCLGSSVLCFAHVIDKHAYFAWLNAGTIAWFLTAPFWFTPGLFGKKFEQASSSAWLRPKRKV